MQYNIIVVRDTYLMRTKRRVVIHFTYWTEISTGQPEDYYSSDNDDMLIIRENGAKHVLDI